MPSHHPDTPSLFEDALQGIERALELNFNAFGTNVVENLAMLRRLADMTRFELEVLFSKKTIISLNDDDLERLQRKIRDLIEENLETCKRQGIHPGA